MEELLWILGATILISLLSVIGVVSLGMKKKTFGKVVMLLVAFSAGGLLGGAFFHLFAESVEIMEFETAAIVLMVGFSMFFLMERVLKWHHCHKPHEEHCETHPFTYLILFGDGLHNFIDGLTIAASFLISIPFGIVTSLLIIGHEVPQELGDFGVLVYGGFGRKKALVYNFLSQLTCVLGGLAGFLIHRTGITTELLLPLAAGGFIYIATSDLIPELHKEPETKKALLAFIVFCLGLCFMLAIKHFVGE